MTGEGVVYLRDKQGLQHKGREAMKREDCTVGMKVYFGRTGGERTPGEIVVLNPAKAKVRQIGERGSVRTHNDGTVWTVPYSLLTPVDSGVESLAKPVVINGVSINSGYAFRHFHRGDYVKFTDRQGADVHGIVERVNKKTVTIRPMEGGAYWRVSPGLLTKIHGRSI